MERNSNNRIKALQIYAAVLTIVFIIFFVAISGKINNLNHFKEIM